jgi:uncharacterized protein (TIRG00374 family)
MKKLLKLLASCAASAFFLWWAFHRVELARVLDILRTVSISAIGLYVVSLAFIQVVRGFRWRTLIRPFASVTFRSAFRVSNVGSMLVMVLPLRLGELARPLMMKRELRVSMSASIGAVMVERVVDGLTVTLLFFLTTLANPSVPAGVRAAAYGSLALFLGAGLFLVLTLVARPLAVRTVQRLVSPFSPKLSQRMTGMADAFADGVKALPDWRAMLAVLAWTLAYWFASGVGFFCVGRGFGWQLPLSAGFTIASVLVIAIMIPAGPGFLGTFQGGIVAALAIYNIGINQATAYGLIVYPINALISIGFGLPHLFATHTRIGEMLQPSSSP